MTDWRKSCCPDRPGPPNPYPGSEGSRDLLNCNHEGGIYMRTAAVTVLAFLMLLPALPAQAQVGYHAGVAMDLWDRDAGY